MRSVSIEELEKRLREYISLAGSGETVLVTDGDQVVAEIGPPKPARSAILDDAGLAELVRTGCLTPPLLPSGGEPPSPEPVAPLRDLLVELDEARSDR